MMQKPKTQGRKNSQLSVAIKETLEKSPRATSVVGSQVVSYVPDHVEGLVKNIEEKGIDKKEEDEAQQGDKRRREEGGTPEEQKRASKILMSKSSGGSKIAAPTKIHSLIL